MNVYEKLQACRVALQDAGLKKSGQNKFAGFRYFELTDFLPTVNRLFHQSGLTSIFRIEGDRATLSIIDTNAQCDSSLKEVEFCSPIADASVKGCTPIQAIGSAHTYLRRYLYIAALEIAECDMLDAKVGDMGQEERVEEEEQTDWRDLFLREVRLLGLDAKAEGARYGLSKTSGPEDYKKALEDVRRRALKGGGDERTSAAG